MTIKSKQYLISKGYRLTDRAQIIFHIQATGLTKRPVKTKYQLQGKLSPWLKLKIDLQQHQTDHQTKLTLMTDESESLSVDLMQKPTAIADINHLIYQLRAIQTDWNTYERKFNHVN